MRVAWQNGPNFFRIEANTEFECTAGAVHTMTLGKVRHLLPAR
jgi:hypothetical protein